MSRLDWQVWLDEEPRSAAWNMALDEALLGAAATVGVPVLRLYRWAEPSVSFGYFDRWSTVQSRFPTLVGVRRWTGGGAVEHGSDVTFALVAPRAHPLGQMTALESYRCIHEVLREALRQVGLETSLAAACGPGAARPAEGPAPCFVAPVCSDLLAGQAKVAGGAQRRTRLGLLHQGSLQGPPLTPDVREAVRQVLVSRSPTSFAGRDLVEKAAAGLVQDRYGTAAWLERW